MKIGNTNVAWQWIFLSTIAIYSCNGNAPASKEKLSPADSIIAVKADSIKLQEETFINPDTAGKRTLYLTFDDGPYIATPNVMAIINEEKVPCSFFIVGHNALNSPVGRQLMPKLRAMKNAVLCNHSYTHAFDDHYERFYADLPGSLADIIKCRDSVGFNNRLLRCPGNNIWRTPKFSQTTFARYKPAANNFADNGFLCFGWDAEWRHRKNKLRQSVEKMHKEIEDMFDKNNNIARNHCVLLMHDMEFRDPVDSTKLHQLIQSFKNDNRYRFDVVTNHPWVAGIYAAK